MLNHLRHRPALVSAALTAAIIGILAGRFTDPLSAALIGWCAGVVVYLIVDIWIAAHATVKIMRGRAQKLEEGRTTALIITVGAAVASLAAIVVNLAGTRDTPHSDASVILAAVTVLLSWIFVHTVFAFTYAHDYYKDSSGLLFPKTEQPDYWDFAYFAFVIGATAQVSDVSITSKSIRRLALAHGVISFFFNTAILAFGVNLAAGLSH
jgi:uncharacterized membrane protein